MLIKLPQRYSEWLRAYKALYQKEPTYVERTEAFIAIRNGTKPNWIKE
jgi:hypothetical protein